jgi:hypothetical protein
MCFHHIKKSWYSVWKLRTINSLKYRCIFFTTNIPGQVDIHIKKWSKTQNLYLSQKLTQNKTDHRLDVKDKAIKLLT